MDYKRSSRGSSRSGYDAHGGNAYGDSSYRGSARDHTPAQHDDGRRPSSSRGQSAVSRYSRASASEQYGVRTPRSSANSDRFRSRDRFDGRGFDRISRGRDHDYNDRRDDQRDGRGDSSSGQRRARITRGEYERQRAQKRTRVKVIVAAVAAAVVITGGTLAFAWVSGIAGNLGLGVNDDLRNVLVHTDLANEPFYLLLMGTDGSNDREASQEFAGDQFRSDSIMLARIDPVDKKVTLVSIHRDTLVDMGEYGQNKLNAAHAIGGPALSVQTVSKLAGVPISHYAEINFDGFKDVVDALGGVEVDVPMTIDDEDAGGHLDAGLQTLNGDQALILCRARHAYDEMGDGDSYRAANQRLVLAAIAKKLLASDIVTMTNTVRTMSEYITTDLSLTDILGLAQAMQGLDTETGLYSAMEPTTSEYIDDIWYEINDTEAWRAMMRRVDSGLPPTEDDVVDPTTGTIMATAGTGQLAGRDSSLNADGSPRRSGKVAVRNGNGVPGAGEEASALVQALGYTVDSGNAEAFDYPTTLVVYGTRDNEALALEIAKALGVGEIYLNDNAFAFDGDFLVVLGADWLSRS